MQVTKYIKFPIVNSVVVSRYYNSSKWVGV